MSSIRHCRTFRNFTICLPVTSTPSFLHVIVGYGFPLTEHHRIAGRPTVARGVGLFRDVSMAGGAELADFELSHICLIALTATESCD